VADVTVKVLDPPDSRDFLSLEEAQTRLGLPTTGGDPAANALLQIQITDASALIARLCNRQFAKTRVSETWRGNNHDAIYLRLWPVDDGDLEEINGTPFDPDQHELENYTGKLRVNGFGDPITIVYSGGYDLPDEAPDELKAACILIMRNSRSEAQRESVEGIRMLAHKESRVIFFDPNTQKTATAAVQAGGLGSGVKQVDDLLRHFIRDWV
jgi:hypothetical protein